MFGFGVLDHGPAGVGRRLCTVRQKKKKKTSRGKVLNLKILSLNRKTMMKYCWSLLITDLEDLAFLKFYLLIEPFHIIETVLEQIKTWSTLHYTLYQTVLSKKKAENARDKHQELWSLVKENVKWVDRGGRFNVLVSMANCDTCLYFLALLSF